jgi:hypothetical protein
VYLLSMALASAVVIKWRGAKTGVERSIYMVSNAVLYSRGRNSAWISRFTRRREVCELGGGGDEKARCWNA